MRGIILAGGTGSPLFPLTRVIDQYLLPLGKYPMVFYPLERLKKAGIKQVLIVARRDSLGPIIRLLGSGASYGLELMYLVREKPPGVIDGLPAELSTESSSGILADLKLASDFAQGDPILVVLGNQIFRDDLAGAVAQFQNQPSGAKIFLKEVSNLTECTIAEIKSDQLSRIGSIHSNLSSKHCVTGIYMFDARVFDFINKLKLRTGKEPGITDVLNTYLISGELSYQNLRNWWVEVETFQSMELANEYAQGVELEFP